MKEYTPSGGQRLINPGPVIIVTCGPVETPNAITLAWSTVVSKQPPLVAISVGPQRYSHDLIKNGGSFVINVPSRDLLKAVMVCGTRSGRDGEKFTEAGLTPVPAKTVSTVYIEECSGRLECELYKSLSIGDHTLFIGEVKAAFADESAFDGYWDPGSEAGRVLHHLGGPYFGVLGERLKFES